MQQLHLEGGQDAAHPHAAGAKFSSAALADVLAACTRIVDLCLGVSFCKQRSHPQRSDRSDECAQLAGALRGSTAIKSSRCGDADEAVGDGGGAQERARGVDNRPLPPPSAGVHGTGIVQRYELYEGHEAGGAKG